MDSSLEKGRKLLQDIDPELESILAERYDHLVPEFAESVVDMAYGRMYAREGLDIKTRLLATIAALTALGAQTAPQLKVNITNALKAGVSKREICEVIFQMTLYGGFPAMVNAMNAAKDVFKEQEAL